MGPAHSDREQKMPETKSEGKVITDPLRQEAIRVAREARRHADIPDKPPMTAEELQEAMRLRGIRPEDRILTSELMRMRYGDEGGLDDTE